MVAGAADPDGAAVGAGAAECAEPGRPAGDGRGEALQGERAGCAASEPGMDGEVRDALRNAVVAECSDHANAMS